MASLLRRQMLLVLLALALVGCTQTDGARSDATPMPATSPPVVSTATVTTTGSPQAATPSAAVPSGWNPSASSAGLTLSVQPKHGEGGSGVRIQGSIAPNLMPSTQIDVEFWPGGPHKPLGDRAQTKYTGPVWPSRWPVRPGPDGRFTLDIVKVPRVIQTTSGDLWLIEPGAHDFALVLDSQHATFAPFRVDAPPPPPATLPPPTVQFQHLWLADARSGWLSGVRCQEPLPPTPDANGNIPWPSPPQCQGLIVGTTNGGQTWQEQYRGDAQAGQIQFAGTKDGWALGAAGTACPNSTCPSALLRTTDGGARWSAIFTTTLRNPSIAFTSPTAGWLVGDACPTSPVDPVACVGHLLTTTDGGQTWRDATLPIKGASLALAHPAPSDGWIVASDSGPGPTDLIVTHDGGATWQTLTNPAAPGFAFAQSLTFRTSTQGWLLGGSEPGAGEQMKVVFATSDGGRTWTTLAHTDRMGQPQTNVAGSLPIGGYLGPMVASSDRDLWIASARGALLHSADGGKTWQGAAIKAYYFVDVQFADAQNGWALSIEDRGLWATRDSGNTWRQVAFPTVGPSTPPTPTTGPATGSATTWEWVTLVRRLWLASATTGWVAGQRCQEQFAATPAPGATWVPLDRKDCQNVIAGTTDGGTTWQTQNIGDVSVGKIQFSGAKDGWAIGRQGTQCSESFCPSALLRTTDGGQHWATVYTTTLRLADLAVASPIDVWLFGQDCADLSSSPTCTWHLLTTGDGGQAWHESALSFTGHALAVARPAASDGWIAYTGARPSGVRLLVTQDGGQTWQSLSSPVDSDANADFGLALRIFFRNPAEGWLLAPGEPSAGSQPKELFHTDDGGKTWTKLAWTHTWNPTSTAQGFPDYGYVLDDGAMVFTTAQDGWIAMPRGGLLHSGDGGRTWQRVPIADDDVTDLHFANPNVGWAGGPAGVWATSNGGKTWEPIPLPEN